MLGRFVGLGAVLVVLLALPGSAAGQAATGDLVIQKIAPQGSTNTYTFTVNPGGTVLQTTGSGTTAATPLAPGTDYSITESDIPALEEVSLMRCRVTGGPFTGTWESGTSTISGIEIVAGATTKCDVFNDPRRLLLETTNDGNGDGTFTKDETVPTGATFPRTVTFRAVMTNTTSSNTDFLTITNDAAADPLQTAGPGLDCADVDGVPAKSTVTCFYDRSFGATGPPAETDTLAVAGSVFSEVEFRATDSSIVRFGPSLAITKTPSAQSVPAGSPLGFGIVVANAGRAASGPVTLTDPLPANPGLSWSVSPAVAGCSITAGTLTCDLGPLAVGASAQINVTSTTTRAACGPVTNTAAATADGVTVSSTAMSAVQCFGVTLDKQGPPVAHHGDSLRYTFAVANAGGLGVDGVVVSDDKCAVGATPVERRNDDGDGLLETPGTDGQTSEVWVYACTTTAPAHAAGETLPLHNVATVNGSAGGNAVTAIDSYDTQIIHPAVNIVDQGPARATAGTLLQYVLTVTNPGDVALTGNTVAVTDADCDAAPALRDKGGDASSDALNPGDTWTYTCSHATTARRAGRQAQTVPNRATVAGTDPLGARVTDDDAVETALETVPAPDPDPTPDGGVRGNRERSGSARLRGPARCVRNAFAVRIRGRRMRTVTVTIDGRRVRAFASPGRTVAYRVRTGRYAPGVHRLRARVAFARASDTAPRTLRFAFQRCRERVVPPPFTG